jgi:ferrochelatase
MRPGVLFINFGGPTRDEELVPFLRNLLADVLPGPAPIKQAAASLLAPRRADRVRERYRGIGWSPVTADTHAQLEAVRAALGDAAPPMAAGMMFTEPGIASAAASLLAKGVDTIVAVGLFPQWSFATTSAGADMLHDALRALGRPEVAVHHAAPFFEDPSYIRSVVGSTRRALAGLSGDGPVELVFSAHGLPDSFIRRGDPYPDQSRATARAVVRALDWQQGWHFGWQSRLGPVRWIGPNTVDLVTNLGRAGAKRLLVVPLSFVGEHIETLDELDRELADHARQLGIPHFARAAAPGLDPDFISALTAVVQRALASFGRASCSRCLVPKPAEHFRQKTCHSCGFVFPRHQRERVAPS